MPNQDLGETPAGGAVQIDVVGYEDLTELLPLVRAYCDFYGVAPDDAALLELSKALVADPEREGRQWLARVDYRAVGFATVYWSWSTLAACRIGTLYDLFVEEGHRGRGVARALIGACLDACAEHGASELCWQTALDNVTAQRLYDGIGAERSHWLDYSLPIRTLDRGGLL